MTAEIAITSLTAGTPLDTDVYPAVDTTDTTQAASGTTKKYNMYDLVDFWLTQLGFNTIAPCRVATTAALTVTYANGALGVGATLTNAGAQAVLAIDGKTLAVNDRVVVKNQAAPAQNGIYTVTNVGSASTNWVMTRATDWNVQADMADKQPVVIYQGATNGGLVYETSLTAPVVVGTDAINFVAFSVSAGLLTTPVSLANGGTNKANVASAGSVAYSTATQIALSAVGASGQLFYSTGVTAPAWTVPTYPIASGALGKFLQADGTNNVYSAYKLPTAVPAAGDFIVSNGTDMVALATANSAMISTNASGVPSWSASATNGQLMIGSTGAQPALGTITAGTGITVTNGAGSITITASGSGAFNWNHVTGTSASMTTNAGYLADNAGLVTLTLPTTAALGDELDVIGVGAGGWKVAQNANQVLHIGSSASTSGVGGSVASTNAHDCVTFVCTVANLEWTAYSIVGNLTVV